VVSPDSSTVYIANSLDGTVSVINAGSNTVEKSLFAGSSPQELAISSDGSKLYVSNHVSPGTITVLDLLNGGTPHRREVKDSSLGRRQVPDKSARLSRYRVQMAQKANRRVSYNSPNIIQLKAYSFYRITPNRVRHRNCRNLRLSACTHGPIGGR
jgi:YVTN family beta-propeller protein